jgi:hypothetical protein
MYARLAHTAPRQTFEPLLTALFTAETTAAEIKTEQAWSHDIPEQVARGIYGGTITDGIKSSNPESAKCLLTRVINRWTTLPVPTTETWQAATTQDKDLNLIRTHMENGTPLTKGPLENTRYHKEWLEGRLETENGILYQLEVPKATRIRQLRRKIVPITLRPTILAAYHATPLAGHTGFYKTYWRIAARYWWPGMSSDIKEAVLTCGHCRVANSTSHRAQQIIGALSTDEPFDIISMDIWYPGKTINSQHKSGQKAVLTSLCNTTGFASTAFISQINSDLVTRLAFAHFFVPNGLPKLIIIDEGSEFKGFLVLVCETLGIQYYVAPAESHNAVLCERFHRYLNKVAKIGVADQQSYEQWALNTLFAAYAWNASPVDGTDVIRSFAAKARTFRFPLDIQTDEEVARIPQQGEAALQHVETMLPLWVRQKELLKLLNEERRSRHREMANKDKKKRTFQPGDLVLVRKQVTSKANDGKPAKLTLRARGPYRILEPAGDNSYWLQKIPAIQGLQRTTGKKHRELAMRLEKLPSSLVIHKRVDTLDTRLAQMEGQLANNPLERNLGFFDFGKYTTAPDDAAFAFVKVNDMWNDPIDAQLDSEDEASEDGQEEQEQLPNQFPAEADTDQFPMATTEEPAPVAATEQPATNATPEPTRKRRKRKRQMSDEAHTPEQRIQRRQIETTAHYLRQLWTDTETSTDRLFFIRRLDPGNSRAQWHLVQVDMDETNQRHAKTQGTYHVRYYIRHHVHSKTRTTQECKHWPLIREIKPDGNFGAIIMVQPDRVDKYLAKRPSTVGWYQMEANLAECGIIGPFDFAQVKGEHHRIAHQHWTKLVEQSHLLDFDARDVNKVIPLG